MDGGQGYPTNTDVTVAVSPTGERAVLNTIFNSFDGSIVTVIVTDGGGGYNQSSPPLVLVGEPPVQSEHIDLIPTIQGFSGIITGILATGGIGPVTKGIQFFYEVDDGIIPSDLNATYSVVVNGTPVGNGVESIAQNAGQVVGFGTQYLDAVYEVRQNNAVGRRGSFQVNVSSGTDLTGINTFGGAFGYFSWGRLSGIVRDIDNALTYTVDGTTYTENMEAYPAITRETEGLRNEEASRRRYK